MPENKQNKNVFSKLLVIVGDRIIVKNTLLLNLHETFRNFAKLIQNETQKVSKPYKENS